jgi:predicted DNA-binding transcriptional regulator AlpA
MASTAMTLNIDETSEVTGFSVAFLNSCIGGETPPPVVKVTHGNRAQYRFVTSELESWIAELARKEKERMTGSVTRSKQQAKTNRKEMAYDK